MIFLGLGRGAGSVVAKVFTRGVEDFVSELVAAGSEELELAVVGFTTCFCTGFLEALEVELRILVQRVLALMVLVLKVLELRVLELRVLWQKPEHTSLEALEPFALLAQTACEEFLSLRFLLLRN